MIDTAGNEIFERGYCRCGLTGGCDECMPQPKTQHFYPNEPVSIEEEKSFYKEVMKTNL